MKPNNLDERIANAFKNGARSDDVATLIIDAEKAAKAATAAAAQARAKALDPTITQAEVVNARRAMEDSSFAHDRLDAAVTRLRDRYRSLLAREEDARRTVVYNKVIAERDRLASELKALYPPVVAQLVELLTRIAANDREVAVVNTRLPDGGSRVLEAELIARGMPGYVDGGIHAVSLLAETRLPAWVPDPHQPYTWPIDERLRPPAMVTQIRA